MVTDSYIYEIYFAEIRDTRPVSSPEKKIPAAYPIPLILNHYSVENKPSSPMAFNKSHLFDPADQLTSAMAQLISHPVRVDILRYLAQNGPTSVEKLANRYPLAKSTVSQHLEYFRKADLVKYQESYPNIIYSIDLQPYIELYTKLMDYCHCLEQAIYLMANPPNPR